MLRCLLPFAITHRLSTKINKGLVSSLIIFSGHLNIENCHGYICNLRVRETLKVKIRGSRAGEKHQHLFSQKRPSGCIATGILSKISQKGKTTNDPISKHCIPNIETELSQLIVHCHCLKPRLSGKPSLSTQIWRAVAVHFGCWYETVKHFRRKFKTEN